MRTLDDLYAFWFGPIGAHFWAGVLIPCAVSAVAVVLYRAEVRALLRPVLFCAVANIPAVAYQIAAGWGGELHLFATFAFVLWQHRRQRINPLVAYACTWLSLVVIDLAAGYAILVFTTPNAADQLVLPLAWLGAAGFFDGLFVFPMFGALLAVILAGAYHACPACGTTHETLKFL